MVSIQLWMYLLHGVPILMEKYESGVIGYAFGSQLAGGLLQYVSPMAILYCFHRAMIITIVGVLSIKIARNLLSQIK